MTSALIASHGAIRQIAWVTDDLDGAIAHWRTMAGVGPWTIYRNVTLDGEYHGMPATVKIDVGLAYQHDMQIELIAPHGNGPSPYHQADGRPKQGMHHIAWLVSDVASATEGAATRGLQCVFRAEGGDGATRVAYLAPPGDGAPLFELIEATPTILDGFSAGIAAAHDQARRDEVIEIDLGA